MIFGIPFWALNVREMFLMQLSWQGTDLQPLCEEMFL